MLGVGIVMVLIFLGLTHLVSFGQACLLWGLGSVILSGVSALFVGGLADRPGAGVHTFGIGMLSTCVFPAALYAVGYGFSVLWRMLA